MPLSTALPWRPNDLITGAFGNLTSELYAVTALKAVTSLPTGPERPLDHQTKHSPGFEDREGPEVRPVNIVNGPIRLFLDGRAVYSVEILSGFRSSPETALTHAPKIRRKFRLLKGVLSARRGSSLSAQMLSNANPRLIGPPNESGRSR